MRDAILKKPNTSEIIARTALQLSVRSVDVSNEIKFFWMDIEQMFNHNCGYGADVPHFGSFIFYARGVSKSVKELEQRIKKGLRYLRDCQKHNAKEKAATVTGQINDLMTDFIFLIYSIELYEKEVLASYPRKYKIERRDRINATIQRLEQLFNVSLDKFPVTLRYPLQKIFVQALRKKGILRNPVIDVLGKRIRHKDPKV